MNKSKYLISFLTPVFLGNAEQSLHWRIFPFKVATLPWGH